MDWLSHVLQAKEEVCMAKLPLSHYAQQLCCCLSKWYSFLQNLGIAFVFGEKALQLLALRPKANPYVSELFSEKEALRCQL